jgi:hypothetical protein
MSCFAIIPASLPLCLSFHPSLTLLPCPPQCVAFADSLVRSAMAKPCLHCTAPQGSLGNATQFLLLCIKFWFHWFTEKKKKKPCSSTVEVRNNLTIRGSKKDTVFQQSVCTRVCVFYIYEILWTLVMVYVTWAQYFTIQRASEILPLSYFYTQRLTQKTLKKSTALLL